MFLINLATDNTNTAANSNSYSTDEMNKMIERYQKTGLVFIPTHFASKKDHFVAWGKYQTEKPSENDIKYWKSLFWCNPSNISIICGDISGKFVPIDFDDKVKFYIAKAFYQVNQGKDITEETPVVKSSRGFHVWLKIKQPIFNDTFFSGIEIRGNGKLITAPPSTHEKGHVYKFIDPTIETILELDNLSDFGITSSSTLWATKDTPQLVKDVIEGVSEGERNTTCLKLALHFCNDLKLPKDVAVEILEEWASKCEPPYDDGKGLLATVNKAYSYSVPEKGTSEEVVTDEQVTGSRTLDEIRTAAKPLQSLWGDILYPSSLNELYGAGEAGKTTFLYNFLMELSLGNVFAGFKPIKPLNVLYLDCEGGDSEIKDRGDTIDTNNQSYPNFHIMNDIYDSVSDVERIINEIKKHSIDILVIDTLSMAFNTDDENNNAEGNKQMKFLRKIALKHGVNIIMVHHEGQAKVKNEMLGGRGASSRHNAANMIFRLIRDGNLLTLKIIKNRFRMYKPELMFKNNNGKIEFINSKFANPTIKSQTKNKLEEKILIVMAKKDETSRKEILESKEIKQLNLSESTIGRALKNLGKQGKTERVKQGKYRLLKK